MDRDGTVAVEVGVETDIPGAGSDNGVVSTVFFFFRATLSSGGNGRLKGIWVSWSNRLVRHFPMPVFF